MASGTKVVYWSGYHRWNPNLIDGYLVEIVNGKIVSAEPITEMPKGVLVEFKVPKNKLEQLPRKMGEWASQWAESETGGSE